jgi:hypothetical protein
MTFIVKTQFKKCDGVDGAEYRPLCEVEVGGLCSTFVLDLTLMVGFT